MSEFANEADLVAKFCAYIERLNGLTHFEHPVWTMYHETDDWDVVLVDQKTGVQIGVEAKMVLNAKVLEQALPYHYSDGDGPDYRAVLVARTGLQNHLTEIAHHLGITIILPSGSDHFNPSLPDEESRLYGSSHWHPWLPRRRCVLPDYVPDVSGGKPSPLSLTQWKVKAIKLMILLERNGFVTRNDMKVLDLSQTRWTDHFCGFLTPGPGGYVRCPRTPDLKAEHPKNWAEIEADFDKWSAGTSIGMLAQQQPLDLPPSI